LMESLKASLAASEQGDIGETRKPPKRSQTAAQGKGKVTRKKSARG
jgi:hypothetical protein